MEGSFDSANKDWIRREERARQLHYSVGDDIDPLFMMADSTRPYTDDGGAVGGAAIMMSASEIADKDSISDLPLTASQEQILSTDHHMIATASASHMVTSMSQRDIVDNSASNQSNESSSNNTLHPSRSNPALSVSQRNSRRLEEDLLDPSTKAIGAFSSRRKGRSKHKKKKKKQKREEVFVYQGPGGPKPNPETLESVAIEDESITTIPNDCFVDCYNLKSVMITSPLTSIGDGAFRNCSSLQSIELPPTLETIPNDCFVDCRNLKSVTISSPLTSIGDGAFRNCYALLSIELPPTLETIPNDCFVDCHNLKSVTISSPLQAIGDRAFQNCSSLNSIELRSESHTRLEVLAPNIRSIGRRAFEGCRNLDSLLDYTCQLYTNGDLKLDVLVELLDSEIYSYNLSWLKNIHPRIVNSLFEKSPGLKKQFNIHTFSRRTVFFLISEIYMNIWLCIEYGWSVVVFFEERHWRTPEMPIVVIFGYFGLREACQCIFRPLRYIRDPWNVIDLARLALLPTAVIFMRDQSLASNATIIPDATTHVLWTTGVILLLSLMASLRTAFKSFARFIGGIFNVFWVLIPFLSVSILLLLMFGFAYYVLEQNDRENCTEKGFCTLESSMLTVLQYFLVGGMVFESKWWLDIAFGLVNAVVLLNVVIAIVDEAWEDIYDQAIFLRYRLAFLIELEEFFPPLLQWVWRVLMTMVKWLPRNLRDYLKRIIGKFRFTFIDLTYRFDRLGDRTFFDQVSWAELPEDEKGIRADFVEYMKRLDFRSFERDIYWLNHYETSRKQIVEHFVGALYSSPRVEAKKQNEIDDKIKDFKHRYNVPESKLQLFRQGLLYIVLLPLGLLTLGLLWPDGVRRRIFNHSAKETDRTKTISYEDLERERDMWKKKRRSIGRVRPRWRRALNGGKLFGWIRSS